MDYSYITIPLCIFIISYIIYKITGYQLIATFYTWCVFLILIIMSIFIPRFKYIIYIILVIYYNNIKLLVDVSTSVYKILYKYNKQKDNNIVRNISIDIFNNNFRFIHNFDKIPKIPTIFVVNYVNDRVENIALCTFPINTCSIFAGWLSPLNNILTPIIFRKDKGNDYDNIKNKVLNMHNKGFHIFSYIERPCSSINYKGIGKIRSGMFSIAKELGISVTPVIIDRIQYSNFGLLRKQNFQIYVGDSINVLDIKKSMRDTKNLFKNKMHEFINQKYDNMF